MIHRQVAIGAHRERMRHPHRNNLANSSNSGRSTSIVTPCDEPPPAEEESLPTAIATYSVIATPTAIATRLCFFFCFCCTAVLFTAVQLYTHIMVGGWAGCWWVDGAIAVQLY